MKEGAIIWFFLVILLLVAVPFGISSCNNSRAELAVSEARADAIRWEAQAMATAITIAASTPVIVFGGVFVIALAVVALAMLMVFKSKAAAPPAQIIERQIFYLPPPGQRRQETWQAMSSIKELPPGDVLLLETGREIQNVRVSKRNS